MATLSRRVVRPLQPLLRYCRQSRIATQRRLESTSSSTSSTSQSPSTATPPSATSTKQGPPPNIYKQFGRPFAKVFLGAMLTYQTLYWLWEKLRLDEVKREKLGEVKALEDEIEEYRLKKGSHAKA